MAARDSDPFNRWQAAQTLATALLVGNVARLRADREPEVDEGLLDALAAILADDSLEPPSAPRLQLPPSEADIAREIGRDVDPDAIFRARMGLRALIGLHLNAALTERYRGARRHRPLQPGRRLPAGARCANVCSTCWWRPRSATPSHSRPRNTAMPTT
jgi:aminopeptidase N